MAEKRQILLMVAGFLAAALILVSQSGYYYFASEARQIKLTEQADSKDVDNAEKESETIFQIQDAVTHVLNFNLEHILHVIYSFRWEIDISVPILNFGDIAPVKVYLETLLQRIISPNAP